MSLLLQGANPRSCSLLFCGPSVWVRVSVVIHLPIQMLICPQDALTDTPRDHVSPAVWAPLSPVKLTHGINRHKKSRLLHSSEAYLVSFSSDFSLGPVHGGHSHFCTRRTRCQRR